MPTCPVCGNNELKVIIMHDSMGCPLLIDNEFIIKCTLCGVMFQNVHNEIKRKIKLKKIMNKIKDGNNM